MPDAAGAAMDQHALTGLQSPMPKQPLPRREAGQRDRRSFREADVVRFRGHILRSHQREFRIAAVIQRQHREDFVAFLQARTGSGGYHDAAGVSAEHVGQLIGLDGAVAPRANFVIDGIYARRADPHQRLAASGLRGLDVLPFEGFNAAELVDANRFHCIFRRSWTRDGLHNASRTRRFLGARGRLVEEEALGIVFLPRS